MYYRRHMLVILAGLIFLLVITLLILSIPPFLPHRNLTVANQVVQAGPYQVTLSISPYLPHVTDAADLTIQIVQRNTHQLVTNASVFLEDTMETMDMGTSSNQAKLQGSGNYLAHLSFTMSGLWHVHVLITMHNEQRFNATFEVKAQ